MNRTGEIPRVWWEFLAPGPCSDEKCQTPFDPANDEVVFSKAPKGVAVKCSACGRMRRLTIA